MASILQHQDRTTLLNALADTPQFATTRGRQVIVRSALGGYPHSGEIDKALRFLDWEGEPIVVADQLLRLLAGHEPAPGVSALGLIAQAIEPMAGAHRGKITDLRRRMGWGADFANAPATPWQDERSAAEVVEERIIGENTLRPLYYLRRALRAADAVVRVDVDGGHGTGFLVAPNLMMTNNHVIGNEDQARRAHAVFFDELPDVEAGESVLGRKHIVVRAAGKQALLHTSKELDYSLIRLSKSPPLEHYLPIRPARVEQNQRVVIIQHAGGEPKRVSLQNNLVAYGDDRLVQYYTSTLQGSSGSPVLDDSFAVVAIHRGWNASPEYKGEQIRVLDPKQIEGSQYRNQGTSMIAIQKDLEKSAPKLLQELTIRE